MIVIFSLSSIPGESLPHTDISFADKAVHFIVYAVLAFFSARAFLQGPAESTRSLVQAYAASAGLCLAWGASDEIHQLLVPGRSCDFWDFCADAASVLAVHVVYYTLSGKMKNVPSR